MSTKAVLFVFFGFLVFYHECKPSYTNFYLHKRPDPFVTFHFRHRSDCNVQNFHGTVQNLNVATKVSTNSPLLLNAPAKPNVIYFFTKGTSIQLKKMTMSWLDILLP